MNHKINEMRIRFGKVVSHPGKLFIVGGAVRDALLGVDPKDIDFVCVGTLADVVAMFGNAEPIHPHAPVFGVKFEGEVFEVALAREETSVGAGSEGFEFSLANSITADLIRRDFTVNAIAVDVATGEVHDPFGGQEDIRRKFLRPVSDKFTESPERVGRAAMMIARFGFLPTQELRIVCRGMIAEFARIPPEQMWRQFFGKLLAKGTRFQQAFGFLESVGALDVFPELVAMRNCPQDPAHHPEGNVLNHTLLTMEVAAQFGSLLTVAAMLFHDMGKPETTVVSEDGDVTAHGHEHAHGAALSFMDRIDFPHALRQKVLTLVDCHMRKNNIPNDRSRARLLRKLTDGGVTASDFADVVSADINGRGSSRFQILPKDVIDFVNFADTFEVQEVASKQARPLIDGNDLIAAGFTPGRSFTVILNAVQEAFLSREISTKDEALALAREVRDGIS